MKMKLIKNQLNYMKEKGKNSGSDLILGERNFKTPNLLPKNVILPASTIELMTRGVVTHCSRKGKSSLQAFLLSG